MAFEWLGKWFRKREVEDRKDEVQAVLGRLVRVKNEDRHFGAAPYYYACLIEIHIRGRKDNLIVPFAFTDHSAIEQIKRGLQNKEDIDQLLRYLGKDLKYVDSMESLEQAMKQMRESDG